MLNSCAHSCVSLRGPLASSGVPSLVPATSCLVRESRAEGRLSACQPAVCARVYSLIGLNKQIRHETVPWSVKEFEFSQFTQCFFCFFILVPVITYFSCLFPLCRHSHIIFRFLVFHLSFTFVAVFAFNLRCSYFLICYAGASFHFMAFRLFICSAVET